MSIKLSPKYGANPSITKCFWCGEDTGIVFMGRINLDNKRGRAAEDLEAPKYCVVDYEPCPKCQENFAQGVMMFETTDEPVQEGLPSINTQEGVRYPTGRHIVIKTEAFSRMTGWEEVKAGMRCACDTKTMDALFSSVEE